MKLTLLPVLVRSINEKPPRQVRSVNKERGNAKLWWHEVYLTWSNEHFKEKLRVNRRTFELLLEHLRADLTLQPTNLNPKGSFKYYVTLKMLYFGHLPTICNAFSYITCMERNAGEETYLP